MATIRKRNNGFQAIVRKKGISEYASFKFKKDAVEWATKLEREIDIGEHQLSDKSAPMTLKQALSKYLETASPSKKGYTREKNRILAWQKLDISNKKLSSISGKDLSLYRDEARKSGLKDPTIRNELMLISAVYTIARKDWGYPNLKNPVSDMTLPSVAKSRERRLSDLELEYFLKASPGGMPRSIHIPELILLAIETGMRQSELLKIDWEDVFLTDFKIRLDITKSGEPRDVPLSPKAIEILDGFGLKNGKVFKVGQDALIRGFQKICELGKKLALDDNVPIKRGFLSDLRFHDLRHEAASRWAPKLEMHELCKMFGWKTPSMALKYYHPTAQSIAKKLAQ